MTKLLKVVIVLAVACVWARQAQALSYDGHMAIEVTMNCTAGVSVDGTAYVSSYTIASTGMSNAYLVPGSSATVNNTSACASTLWQLSVATMSRAGAVATKGWTHHNNALVTGHTNNATNDGCLTGCPGANEYGFQALLASSSTLANYGDATGIGGCPAMSSTAWDTNISTILPRVGWATLDTAVTTGTANTYWDAQYTFSGQSATKGKPGPDNFLSHLGYMGPLDETNHPGQGKRAICARVTMPASVSGDTNNVAQVIRLSVYATNSL